MELSPYLDMLRDGLAVAAEAGGEQERAVAERLMAPLAANAQLALLQALSTAADEITAELAPGSVEVRLRGGAIGFAVTPPPELSELAMASELPNVAPNMTPSGAIAKPPEDGSADSGGAADGGATARINLRLPEQLKSRVDQAATEAGLSTNTWLVRAITAALDPSRPAVPGPAARPAPAVPRSGQRYQGWVR